MACEPSSQSSGTSASEADTSISLTSEDVRKLAEKRGNKVLLIAKLDDPTGLKNTLMDQLGISSLDVNQVAIYPPTGVQSGKLVVLTTDKEGNSPTFLFNYVSEETLPSDSIATNTITTPDTNGDTAVSGRQNKPEVNEKEEEEDPMAKFRQIRENMKKDADEATVRADEATKRADEERKKYDAIVEELKQK